MSGSEPVSLTPGDEILVKLDPFSIPPGGHIIEKEVVAVVPYEMCKEGENCYFQIVLENNKKKEIWDEISYISTDYL